MVRHWKLLRLENSRFAANIEEAFAAYKGAAGNGNENAHKALKQIQDGEHEYLKILSAKSKLEDIKGTAQTILAELEKARAKGE